jgi:histidinol-phosphate aminotransferase
MEFDRRRWLKMTAAACASGLTQIAGAGRGNAADSAATPAPTPLRARSPAAPTPAPPAPAPAAATGALARLSLNENPFGPAPGAKAAIAREFAALCRYTTTEYGALIDRIAAKERVPRGQIVLGEILEPLGTTLSLRGGAGGEFVYSDPGYTALIDSAVAVGGRAVAVPLDAELQNDLPALRAAVTPKTRAVSLVNPHNPTGIVCDPAELAQFAREVSRQALIVVDEAYLEFADHFAERTLTGLVRNGENVIVFRTFAKAYGLAGLEIGYGVVPAAIAAALAAQGLDNPHLFNRLAIAAAAASLDDAEYLERVTRQVADERAKWLPVFTDLGLRSTPSQGNFVFFQTGMRHAEFAAALAKAGVDIGRAFAPYDRWARISIGLPEDNARARAAVGRILRRA